MSIRQMTRVWKFAGDVKGNDLVVLLALADWSNDEGECWPRSILKLAGRARVSPRTLTYILGRLEEKGYVRISRGGGAGRLNRYLLTIGPADEDAPHETASRAVGATHSQTQEKDATSAPFSNKTVQKLHGSDGERVQVPTEKDAESGKKRMQLPGVRRAASVFNTVSLNGQDDSNQRPSLKKISPLSTNSPPGSAPPPSPNGHTAGLPNSWEATEHRAPATRGTGPPRASPPPSLPRSEYLRRLAWDLSVIEFDDAEHAEANMTQTLRLWGKSGLGEKEFGELLQEARKRTREYQGKQGLRGIENKMAYFFTVVRDLVRGKEQEQ